jgi:hypothetical protein
MSEARARLDALPNLYPHLFQGGPLPWGFEVGDGWSDLIVTLCVRIDSILREAPGAQFEILQVKEKFGALRFYYEIDGVEESISEAVLEAVMLAGKASVHICERCGRPGDHGSKEGWLFTRCAVCQAGDP